LHIAWHSVQQLNRMLCSFLNHLIKNTEYMDNANHK